MPKKINMPKELLEWLSKAKGRSEFVIACIIDIRGFSAFSKKHESPELAMFIKRFYSHAIENYFPTANFVKPTGDGLLLTFKYEEETLSEVSKTVLEACFKLLQEFPTICNGDPMVNFLTPTSLGIGIARGPACCLHSGERIIDYSGHFLNLASRLMDLARPNGIVVDGNYAIEVIPGNLREKFKSSDIYLIGISEDTPHPIFYQSETVSLPESCLSPITSEKWKTRRYPLTYAQVKKLVDRHHLEIPEPASSAQPKAIIYFLNKKLPNMYHFYVLSTAKYLLHGDRHVIWISMDEIREKLKKEKLKVSDNIAVEISYIPKDTSQYPYPPLGPIIQFLTS